MDTLTVVFCYPAFKFSCKSFSVSSYHHRIAKLVASQILSEISGFKVEHQSTHLTLNQTISLVKHVILTHEIHVKIHGVKWHYTLQMLCSKNAASPSYELVLYPRFDGWVKCLCVCKVRVVWL